MGAGQGSSDGAASETKLPIAMHRWLVTDPRALAHVAGILMAP